VERTRADSIHFLGLDGRGKGAIVGLPRDSYVPIPGHGTDKITGSLAFGGPDLMMETFRNLTELPFEGYILTGFAGFKGVVDEVLGGIEAEVPFPINDVKALASLEAGLQVLDGFDALAFARARKTVPGGDFTRSEHQGSLLIAAAKGVKAQGLAAIPQLMEAAEPYVITDLSPTKLLTLLAMASNVKWGSVPNVVAPGSAGWAGSASVVYLSNSVSDLFDDLANGRLDRWDK
jgi:LCP family protein required for cell wall assembly